jgi:curved DNA-binding protein CbpA
MADKERKEEGKLREYRQILGVNSNTSIQEIKKAYWKLSLKHHPDKGGKVEDFQAINEAYSALTNKAEDDGVENSGNRQSRTKNNSERNNSEIEKWRAENPANNTWQETKNDYSDSPFTPPFPNIHEELNSRKNPRRVPSVQERIKELEEEIAKCKKKFNLSLSESAKKEVEDYIKGLEELLGLFKNEICENREEQLEYEIEWLKRKKQKNPQGEQEVEEEIRKKEQELANLKRNNGNYNNNRRQRERVQQQISQLENKPNKTPEEEQDLINKKEELKKLNNPTNNQESNKHNWIKPTLIVVGFLAIIILIIKIKKNPKKKKQIR